VSTERAVDAWRLSRAGGADAAPDAPSSVLSEAPDAPQIARQLIEKYGIDALAFAEDRAQRAREIGDEFALDAWRDVIAATRLLLRRVADA
jgi:hypothetical protein